METRVGKKSLQRPFLKVTKTGNKLCTQIGLAVVSNKEARELRLPDVVIGY